MIPLILIGLSVLVIFVLLIRAAPRVSMIDVETIPEERARKLKEQLILNRFSRLKTQKFGVVSKTAQGAVKGASRVGRRAVQRLYRLEQQYKKLQKAAGDGQHALDEETVRRLIAEAEDLIRADEFIPAEKKYIEIISHNPKQINAYEGLGNLYLKDRKYEQARETLSFALKISPDDASIHMSMAEVEIKDENPGEALVHLRECFKKRPKNPKYLDLYVETALAEGAQEDAELALAQMKEVNPENTKISEWESMLSELGSGKASQDS